MPARLNTTTDSTRLRAAFGSSFPIIDATDALTITVRPHHVRGATLKSAPCCGIAKALGTKVAILRSCAYVLDEPAKVILHYKHSDSAKAFVSMFDQGALKSISAPVKVTLLPPPPSQARGANRRRHKAKMAAARRTIKAMKLDMAPSVFINPNKAKSDSKWATSPAGKRYFAEYNSKRHNRKAKSRGVQFTEKRGTRTIIINPDGNCYDRIKTMIG